MTLLLRMEGHVSLRRMAVPVLASGVMGGVLAGTGFGGLYSIVVGAGSYAAAFGLTAALLVPDDVRRVAGLLRARAMAVAASPLSARAPQAASPAGPRRAGMPAPATRLADVKRSRSAADVKAALGALSAAAAHEDENLMPLLIDCAKAYCTVGEMVGVLKDQWAEFQQPVVF